MSKRGPERDIEIGEVLSQTEVEDAFGTDFGYQFRGITYRKPPEGKYAIVNSNEGAIYEDEFTSQNVLTYDGEGKPEKGDQKPTTANQTLIDAVDKEIPIYLFTSEDGVDEYEYEGLVEVVNAKYVRDEDADRMKYEFELKKLNVGTWDQYEELAQGIKGEDEAERHLDTDDPEWETQARRVRSAAFSREVTSLYDGICAVCGSERRSPTGNPEIEAAHIYPKGEGGKDVVGNGLGLCKLHHWAFDVGWMAISEEYEVLIRESEEINPPEGVAEYGGARLNLPKQEEFHPAPQYLRAHRQLHGFVN